MDGLLLISFIAGVLTVLAPCILPLLPVIVGGSLSGTTSLRRPVVLVASLGVSVIVFTLLLKVSTAFISVPPLFWQLLSGGLLIVFGLVSFFPTLWDSVPGVSLLYKKSNKLLGTGYLKENIWGDALMGAALGPVFSSCSPTYFVILAAVLPANFAVGVTYLGAYVLGLCLFLLLIAVLGQRIVAWLGIATDPTGWFKKAIGVLFVLVGLAIIFGIDKKIEYALPAGAFGEVGIEQQLLKGSTMPVVASTTNTTAALSVSEKAERYPRVPELVHPNGYFNTDGLPITIGQFKGKKVVLVDFWDYSCINCQRTLPYVTSWYEKYKDQGLVVIGVHTPEFAFEQLQSNVEAAAKRFGITYPVVLDNQYKTWAAFKNQYWPHEYLVDIDGFIVHDHIGEGGYAETEKAIQAALAERAARLGSSSVSTSIVSIVPKDTSGVGSPETYFGASRNQYLGNGTPGVVGVQAFTLPTSPRLNTLYLGGRWDVQSEYARGKRGSSILYEYNARDVYFVATNPDTPVRIKVFRDGNPVGSFAGEDVSATTSEATIAGDRLYTLVHDERPGVHTIEIQVEEGTLDAYTFTFG